MARRMRRLPSWPRKTTILNKKTNTWKHSKFHPLHFLPMVWTFTRDPFSDTGTFVASVRTSDIYSTSCRLISKTNSTQLALVQISTDHNGPTSNSIWVWTTPTYLILSMRTLNSPKAWLSWNTLPQNGSLNYLVLIHSNRDTPKCCKTLLWNSKSLQLWEPTWVKLRKKSTAAAPNKSTKLSLSWETRHGWPATA